MYYVTMTDKFMSGWGHSRGKINKYIVCCATLDEAKLIFKNAQKRSEMKHINITQRKPYYNKNQYLVTNKLFSELGGMWKE